MMMRNFDERALVTLQEIGAWSGDEKLKGFS
jgi:hypothetical protein